MPDLDSSATVLSIVEKSQIVGGRATDPTQTLLGSSEPIRTGLRSFGGALSTERLDRNRGCPLHLSSLALQGPYFLTHPHSRTRAVWSVSLQGRPPCKVLTHPHSLGKSYFRVLRRSEEETLQFTQKDSRCTHEDYNAMMMACLQLCRGLTSHPRMSAPPKPATRPAHPPRARR